MARYIDGDKLLEYYKERHKNLCKKNGETDAYCQGYEDAMYVAEHMDFTADVVPKSEVDYWMDTVANARREILLEIERLALSKIPEDVEVAMLKDTYYIEALDELMIKYGVTDKNVGCNKEEQK